MSGAVRTIWFFCIDGLIGFDGGEVIVEYKGAVVTRIGERASGALVAGAKVAIGEI